MDQQDAISKRWFNPAKVKVLVAADVPPFFDDEVYVGLSGALSDSIVRVSKSGSAIYMEVHHPSIRQMRRALFLSAQTNLWALYNTNLRTRPDSWGQDLAARSLYTQARMAQTLGFDHISADLVGDYRSANNPNNDEKWTGYWVLPRLGFAVVPGDIRQRLPADLRGCKRISDLLATVT